MSPNHPATMASETVSIGTDGDTEPLIDSTRKHNAISVDQATVMVLTINAELKQNSELFVNDIRSITSPLPRGPCLRNRHGQGKLTVFVAFQETLTSKSGDIGSQRLNVNMRYFQQLLWKAGIPIKDG